MRSHLVHSSQWQKTPTYYIRKKRATATCQTKRTKLQILQLRERKRPKERCRNHSKSLPTYKAPETRRYTQNIWDQQKLKKKQKELHSTKQIEKTRLCYTKLEV